MVDSFYKKTGMVVNYLARDFLVCEAGDKCPTIAQCTEIFGVSRRTVQDALALLEKTGCITTEKNRKSGTILTSLNKERLFEMSGIDAITGTMPIPLNLENQGLASGICCAMEASPVPFAFAFIQGSSNRLKFLSKMSHDFTIISMATAKRLLPEYPDLTIVATLHKAIYSNKYVLYIRKGKENKLNSDITIAYDPLCTDQTELVYTLTNKDSAHYIKAPYSVQRALIWEGECDAIVFRSTSELEFSPLIQAIPIPEELYDQHDLQLPVIVCNKNNFGTIRLISHFLQTDEIAMVQKLVISRDLRPRYY